MRHTIDLHPRKYIHESQKESREEERLGRMCQGPLQCSSVHDEASGDSNAEGNEDYEVEDVDDCSDRGEAVESFREDAKQKSNSTRAHREAEISPCKVLDTLLESDLVHGFLHCLLDSIVGFCNDSLQILPDRIVVMLLMFVVLLRDIGRSR